MTTTDGGSMDLSQAQNYKDSFDAVMDGSATDAQCIETQAVAFSLRAYLQEADLRAKALVERRAQHLALLPPDEQEQLAKPGDEPPRLMIDPRTREVNTPDFFAERDAADQKKAVEDSKAAEEKATADAQAMADQADQQRLSQLNDQADMVATAVMKILKGYGITPQAK